MFWGLRECRRINLQPIQQAEVSIECAGARITRSITDVQKFPNFIASVDEANRYKLLVVWSQNNIYDTVEKKYDFFCFRIYLIIITFGHI